MYMYMYNKLPCWYRKKVTVLAMFVDCCFTPVLNVQAQLMLYAVFCRFYLEKKSISKLAVSLELQACVQLRAPSLH